MNSDLLMDVATALVWLVVAGMFVYLLIAARRQNAGRGRSQEPKP